MRGTSAVRFIRISRQRTFCASALSTEVAKPSQELSIEVKREREQKRARVTNWVVGTATLAIGGAMGTVAWDMNRKEWSDYHTWTTALQQYVMFSVMRILGRKALQRLETEAEEGEQTQRRLLAELLARHGETKYGKENDLVGIKTFEEFRKVHPVTRYVHYKPYVTCAAEGQEGVLAPGKPKLIAMTSGTSGSPQLLPHTDDISKNFFLRGVAVAYAVLANDFPGAVEGLQRSMKLIFASSRRELPSGIPVGSNSSSPNDRGFERLLCAYSSPAAAYKLPNERDALYAHAICALADRNLGILEANFAPLLTLIFDIFREKRRSIVQDIRNGHIWDRSHIMQAPDFPLRVEIDERLGGPNADRAAELNSLLADRATITASALWPNLQVVLTTDTGAFSPAAEHLRGFLGEDIPIYSPFYAATEGLLGVNVHPRRPFGVSTYVLDPGSMFFELLPEKWWDEAEPPKEAPVPVWQAQLGEAYEVVATTRGGLCRYRIGDTVRVVGRFGQMPVVVVEGRLGQYLPSLRGERVSESVFLTTLTRVCRESAESHPLRAAAVGDCPSSPLSRDRYHIFWEFDDGGVATAEEVAAFDAALCADHEVYASFRKKGAIKPLQVHAVKAGTFRSLRPALSDKASNDRQDLPPVVGSQIKIPTVVRDAEIVKILLAAEVKTAARVKGKEHARRSSVDPYRSDRDRPAPTGMDQFRPTPVKGNEKRGRSWNDL